MVAMHPKPPVLANGPGTLGIGGPPVCLVNSLSTVGAAVGILDRFSLCCQSEFATVLHRTHIAQIALHS